MIEKFLSHELSRKRWRRFKHHKMASGSALLLIALILLAICAPFISGNRPLYMKFQGKHYFPLWAKYHPSTFGITDVFVTDYKTLPFEKKDQVLWPLFKWDPFESNNGVESFPSPPTASNIMGTDEVGRDVFARILYGFRYSLGYALLVWALSFIIGAGLGGIMGHFGGMVDLVGQRCVEVFSTIPQLFLLLILISIFTPNLLMLVLISALFGWVGISYYIRGEFLKIRKREFVEAGRSLGLTNTRIIFSHILPNALTPVITFSPFFISSQIIALASLDYLGLGLPVPTPSWGELLTQAQKHFTVAWWLAVYPSMALFVTLSLLNLIGEGIRDAMDPNAL